MSAGFFESLESRKLMSASLVNGVLRVVGTNLNDIIAISQDATRVRVNEDGKVTTFALGSVKSINVHGLGGHDQLLARTNLTRPIALRGGEGNDTLVGGRGNDILEGGPGYDRADYSHRSDSLNITLDALANDGGPGEKDNVKSDIELIMTGRGNDMIRGNDLDNFIYPGAGSDTVYGMGGHDLIGLESSSTSEGKTVYGGEGNDSISMRGPGQASVFGEGGNDTLSGGSGADVLDGGAGTDLVSGDSGNDTIRGGADNDTLSGNAGNDDIYGGDGNDLVYGNTDTRALIIKLLPRPGGKNSAIDRILLPIPLLIASTDNDYISGGEGSDTVYAGEGNDTVRGDGWRDSLFGGDGNDLIQGGSGDDIIEGQDGDDTLWGHSAPSPLGNIRIDFGGIFLPTVVLSDVDVIFGGKGNDQLHGNGDGDTLSGGDDHDKLWGDAGNDVLRGNTGNDSLYGGDGNDNLGGDEGDDILVAIGGGNFDSLYGGSGSDQFWGDDVTTEYYDADLGELLFGNVHKVASFVGGVSKNLYGQNLPDPNPLDNNGTATATDDFTPVWNNFRNFPLFSTNGPRATDINQGRAGSCYFLAPLAGMAKATPFRIKQKVVELGDGTYAVQFRTGDTFSYVRVDADLPVAWNGSTTPYFAGVGDQQSVWAAIMEKAFCSVRGDGTYMGIGGGSTRVGFNMLSMRDAGDLFDASSGSATLNNIKAALAQGKLVALSTKNEAVPAGTPAVQNHAYLVESINTIKIWMPGAGGTFFGGHWVDLVVSVTLRNPWGTDGAGNDGNNDGLVTFSAAQIQNSFSSAHAAWSV